MKWFSVQHLRLLAQRDIQNWTFAVQLERKNLKKLHKLGQNPDWERLRINNGKAFHMESGSEIKSICAALPSQCHRPVLLTYIVELEFALHGLAFTVMSTQLVQNCPASSSLVSIVCRPSRFVHVIVRDRSGRIRFGRFVVFFQFGYLAFGDVLVRSQVQHHLMFFVFDRHNVQQTPELGSWEENGKNFNLNVWNFPKPIAHIAIRFYDVLREGVSKFQTRLQANRIANFTPQLTPSHGHMKRKRERADDKRLN